MIAEPNGLDADCVYERLDPSLNRLQRRWSRAGAVHLTLAGAGGVIGAVAIFRPRSHVVAADRRGCLGGIRGYERPKERGQGNDGEWAHGIPPMLTRPQDQSRAYLTNA